MPDVLAEGGRGADDLLLLVEELERLLEPVLLPPAEGERLDVLDVPVRGAAPLAAWQTSAISARTASTRLSLYWPMRQSSSLNVCFSVESCASPRFRRSFATRSSSRSSCAAVSSGSERMPAQARVGAVDLRAVVVVVLVLARRVRARRRKAAAASTPRPPSPCSPPSSTAASSTLGLRRRRRGGGLLLRRRAHLLAERGDLRVEQLLRLVARRQAAQPPRIFEVRRQLGRPRRLGLERRRRARRFAHFEQPAALDDLGGERMGLVDGISLLDSWTCGGIAAACGTKFSALGSFAWPMVRVAFVHAHSRWLPTSARLVGSASQLPAQPEPARRAHTASAAAQADPWQSQLRCQGGRARAGIIINILAMAPVRRLLLFTSASSKALRRLALRLKDGVAALRRSGAQNPAAFQTIFGGLYAGGFAALTVLRNEAAAAVAIGVDMGKRVGGLLDSSFLARDTSGTGAAADAILAPMGDRRARIRRPRCAARKLRRRRPPSGGGGGRRRCCSASASRRLCCSRSSTCGRCASRRSASSRRRRSSIASCRCSARASSRLEQAALARGALVAAVAGVGIAVQAALYLADANSWTLPNGRHPVPAAAAALGAARRRERAGGGAPRVQVRPRPAAGLGDRAGRRRRAPTASPRCSKQVELARKY